MRRLIADMNSTLRGFLLIAVVAGVIVALSLERSLTALFLLARIAFLLAIAFFVYLVWRERRAEIATWPARPRAVLYGAALVVVADFGVFFWKKPAGLNALAFFLVLGFAGFAMWRVWRDQHTYL